MSITTIAIIYDIAILIAIGSISSSEGKHGCFVRRREKSVRAQSARKQKLKRNRRKRYEVFDSRIGDDRSS